MKAWMTRDKTGPFVDEVTFWWEIEQPQIDGEIFEGNHHNSMLFWLKKDDFKKLTGHCLPRKGSRKLVDIQLIIREG